MKYKVIYHKFHKSIWIPGNIYRSSQMKYIVHAHSPKEALSIFSKKMNLGLCDIAVDCIMDMNSKKVFELFNIIN